MLRRALNSKNLIACLLAAGTGLTLYFHFPFPEGNFFLELLFLRASPVFLGARFSYVLFLYTTPYIFYSILLSGLYIAAIKIPLAVAAWPTARVFPSARPRQSLPRHRRNSQRRRSWTCAASGLALDPRAGTVHRHCHIRRRGLRQNQLLHLPVRGADSRLSRRIEPEKRIGGLVLEVKGDFCHKVRDDSHTIRARGGLRRDQPPLRIPLQPLA